jgi:molybdate transport system regulatory protein
MARVSLRLGFGGDQALGPGKIRLLETIAETGSISAAGRAMAMSYRRAWMLVDELNHMFTEPLVEARPGGTNGGGTSLTPTGEDVVRRYRDIEAGVTANSAANIDALEKMITSVRHKPASPPTRKRSVPLQ